MGGMMGMNPMMMGMMGGPSPFGRSPGAAAQKAQDESKPPKERYAEQIQMIKMMFGITDEEAIIKALTDNNGDMDKTMESLMSQFGGDYGDEDQNQ